MGLQADGSGEQPIIFIVRADPEPHNSFRFVSSQCSIMQTDPYRPQLFLVAYFFEVQGRIARIRFKKFEVFIRQLLYVFG